MKKWYCIFFLVFVMPVYGQNIPNNEDKIYNAIDFFVAEPSGENLENLKQFEQKLESQKQLKTNEEFLALVILNCNLGYYQNRFGQAIQAISSYEKAAHIFQTKQLKNYDIVEYCLKPLGNLYTQIGDYENAENTIKQYFIKANFDHNQAQKIAAILNLSTIYLSSGKLAFATELIEKTIQRESLKPVEKAHLYTNLGNCYRIKNFQKTGKKENQNQALKCYQESIKLLENQPQQEMALINNYLNVSEILLNQSQFSKSQFYIDLAQNTAKKSTQIDRRKIAQLDYFNALLQVENNQIEKANSSIKSIFKRLLPNYNSSFLPNQNQLYAEPLLMDALDLQAEIFQKQRAFKKAIQTYQLSFYIEDLISNVLVFENSKIVNQSRLRNRVEKCIAIYDLLFQKHHKQFYLEKAFLLAEKTKSAVLKKSLAEKGKRGKGEVKMLEDLQNWTAIIVTEQQKGDGASIAKINEALQKQKQAIFYLKQKAAKTSDYVTNDLNFNELCSKLNSDDASMIYYFSGKDTFYCFELSDKKISLQSLVNDDLFKNKLTQYLDFFSNPLAIENNINDYIQTSYSVYQSLHLPTKLATKNVILIPDGILNFLPFESLLTKKYNGTNFAKMPYFMNNYYLAYQNSASFYTHSNPLSNEKPSVLGLFPVFEKTKYVLQFSKNEKQSISSKFSGIYLENEKASFENFQKNASKYSILHLSTHADAGDIEIPATIKFYDRDIIYSQLYSLNIHPDLTVLSACQTGIGKLYQSEGALSVARGFQQTGAQNLMFSLWKVNDFTTSKMMDYFYRFCLSNKAYFEANTLAKKAFLEDKTISNTKKSPYYWSAFVYYGTLETPQNSKLWLYFVGVLTFVIFGFYIVWIKKRKTPRRI